MINTCHTGRHANYCDAVSLEIERIVDAVTGVDPATPVPTCPDWTVADLIEHVGGIHRWAERMVREQTPVRIPSRLIDLNLPPGKAEYPAWLAAGGPVLVDTLRQADPDASMWAWGADQHTRFWSRRMVFETAVHRTDAEQAVGRAASIDTNVAVDGIDELLDNLPCAARFAPNVTELRGDGESLRFLAADTGHGWLIELHPDGFSWRHDTSAVPASVGLHGSAADLFMLLWRRLPLRSPQFELSGDAAVLTHWLDKSAL
jgi:uncharacterized protein (TIGR03083 family)